MDDRQFIICSDEIEKEDFHSLALDCGYILYYHKSLQVKQAEDYIIIGLHSLQQDFPVGERRPYSLDEQIQMWVRFMIYQKGILGDICKIAEKCLLKYQRFKTSRNCYASI